MYTLYKQKHFQVMHIQELCSITGLFFCYEQEIYYGAFYIVAFVLHLHRGSHATSDGDAERVTCSRGACT